MNDSHLDKLIKKHYLSKAGLMKHFGLTKPTLSNILSQHGEKIRNMPIGESKRIHWHMGDLAELLK